MFIHTKARSIEDAIKRDMISTHKRIGFREMIQEEVKEYQKIKRRKEYVTIINRRNLGYDYKEYSDQEIADCLKDCQEERKENDPEYNRLYELHLKEIN